MPDAGAQPERRESGEDRRKHMMHLRLASRQYDYVIKYARRKGDISLTDAIVQIILDHELTMSKS